MKVIWLLLKPRFDSSYRTNADITDLSGMEHLLP